MTRDGSDLDWQAFQYIAGELNSEDAAQFETRLAIDQAAREAVAAAVELSEVAAIAECRPVERVSLPTASHSYRARNLAWLGWGAAACLLVVAFVQQSGWNPWLNSAWLNSGGMANGDSWTRSGDSTAVGLSGHRAHAAPDLALAWVHTRASAPITDRLREEQAHEEQANEGQTAISETNEVDDRRQEETGISAPSWMVIAVAGLNVDMSEVE